MNDFKEQNLKRKQRENESFNSQGIPHCEPKPDKYMRGEDQQPKRTEKIYRDESSNMMISMEGSQSTDQQQFTQQQNKQLLHQKQLSVTGEKRFDESQSFDSESIAFNDVSRQILPDSLIQRVQRSQNSMKTSEPQSILQDFHLSGKQMDIENITDEEEDYDDDFTNFDWKSLNGQQPIRFMGQNSTSKPSLTLVSILQQIRSGQLSNKQSKN